MRKVTLILTILAFVSLGTACMQDTTSSRGQTIESCYDTGYGVKCVATPNEIVMVDRDVNGDMKLDTFLCADAESASDSDSLDDDGESLDEDGADSDESDGDLDGEPDSDMDADSESTSDSDSESDSDCGASDSDSESDEDGTSESDADGDGDADTVPDEVDCDCIDETEPTEDPDGEVL